MMDGLGEKIRGQTQQTETRNYTIEKKYRTIAASFRIEHSLSACANLNRTVRIPFSISFYSNHRHHEHQIVLSDSSIEFENMKQPF